MAIMPKPELERGNFIAYTDEPGMVISGSGGGGGDVQTLHAHYELVGEIYVLDTVVTFNELKSAFDAGSTVHIELTQNGDDYSQVDVCQMVACTSYASDNPDIPSDYIVSFFYQGSPFVLQAESPDDPLAIP